MKKAILVTAMLAMIPFGAALAESASDQKARTLCAGCHGPNGISTNPLWPNLAGQQDQYMIRQMQLYKDGTRPDVTMGPLAETLSDQEIEELAAYYASLPAGG